MAKAIISRVTHRDANDVIHANHISRDYHAPWAAPFADRDGFDAWFGQTVTGPNVGLVVREELSGGVAGIINLSQIVWGGFRSAYVGYYGSVAYAGQGIMTQGLRLVASFAFQDLGLHRLEANIQPGNAASREMAKRVGFRMEGFSPRYLRINDVWCDHERWALLAEDWCASP